MITAIKSATAAVVTKAGSKTLEAGRSAVETVQVRTREAADTVVESGALERVRTQGSKVLAGASRVAGKASELAGDAASRTSHAAAKLAAVGSLFQKQIAEEISTPSSAFVDAVANSLDGGKSNLKEAAGRLLGLERRRKTIVLSAVAIGTAVATAFDKIAASSPAFQDLTPALKAKFAMAGLRDGWRVLPDAKAFYEATVPQSVRHLGEKATIEFLDGKHASHIKSVKNFPELGWERSNIVWERAEWNLVRGDTNMTAFELAKANVANLMDATGIIAVEAIKAVAISGCVGMALEGVVALGENIIYVCADERSVREAAADIGKKTITKTGFAAMSGAAVSVALTLGAGPAITAMAPVLVTIGGTMYVVQATRRIATAVNECKDRESLAPVLIGAPAVAA